MAYKELEVDELTEIDSVGSLISAVKLLKESADGASTELYFRGQDAEFWDIEPIHSKIDTISHIPNDDNLNNYIISNLSNILNGIVESDEVNELKSIIRDNFIVDWYNRETIMSKMRMSILGYYFAKFEDQRKAKNKAIQITDKLKQAVIEYIPTDVESGE